MCTDYSSYYLSGKKVLPILADSLGMTGCHPERTLTLFQP